MMSLKVLYICGLVIVQVAYCQNIVVDTLEDMQNMPGWSVTCDRGYQHNLTNFACHNGLKVDIPAEDLNGEVGFWTGCQSDCILTYLLRSRDEGIRIRAYLKETHITVIKNDVVWEVIKDDKWIDVSIDIEFTRRIGIRMEIITDNAFAVLDKITIISQEPTTTEPTTTRSTIEWSSSPSPY